MPPTINLRHTKHLRLLSALRTYIARHAAGEALPSYTELREKHGVSRGTVERALVELDRAGLITRAYGSGIYIAPRAKQKRLGLVFGRDVFARNVSPVYRTILERAQEWAARSEWRFSFFIDLPEIELQRAGLVVSQQLLETIERRDLDGILLLAPRGAREAAWLQSSGIPMVVLSHEGGAPRVYFDLAAFVRRGVEMLIAARCRRLALVTLYGAPLSADGVDVVDEFRRAVGAAGMDGAAAPVWQLATVFEEGTARHPDNEELGRLAADDLLREHQPGTPLPFDGIVSLDDVATRGILARLRERGLTAGRDFRLASFAHRGSPVLAHETGIDLVELDTARMAQTLLETLQRLMAGAAPAAPTILLQPIEDKPSAHGRRETRDKSGGGGSR